MQRNLLTILAIFISATTYANTFDLATATGQFEPSFRGEANTTYLGWDLFGDPGDSVINDTTPDLGADAGGFVTTNNEDHQSGSLNYYSGSGSVAEDITFATDGVNGSGFTTVIVQAKTLFGGWGVDIDFGPIDGVEPSLVLQATNATGSGQLFVKYELPGTANPETFSMTSGPFSFTSFGEYVVDTAWSPTAFAADTAIATPEPSAAVLFLLSAGALLRRR